ncbi:hypothetical protein EV363DRAFT_1397838 [Boletus edulis]|nr:hypothetical protein EV363DRAFT_1397838 [Boletus edulis]
MNNNPTGKNCWGEKNYPDPQTLQEALHAFSREGLTIQERLDRLKTELGLSIKKTKLCELNKKYGVPSTRKPPAADVATQAVLDKVAQDVNQTNGVGTICATLQKDGSRRVVQTPLCAIGPNHQHHADRFAKLNSQALRMGEVGLDIYAIKDQWNTIGHVHLDCISKHQTIPVTFVTDKGSETGFVFANQSALRTVFAPKIGDDEYPPFLFLKSVHNTPIESFWHIFQDRVAKNFKSVLQQGLADGIYHPNDPAHIQLFKWLWPQILQHEVDDFVDTWNSHRIRHQKTKLNASGTIPWHAFTVPQSQGGQECGIRVDMLVVDALRKEIPTSQEESMCWVDDVFSAMALDAYIEIGQPSFTVGNGWSTFEKILAII